MSPWEPWEISTATTCVRDTDLAVLSRGSQNNIVTAPFHLQMLHEETTEMYEWIRQYLIIELPFCW